MKTTWIVWNTTGSPVYLQISESGEVRWVPYRAVATEFKTAKAAKEAMGKAPVGGGVDVSDNAVIKGVVILPNPGVVNPG